MIEVKNLVKRYGNHTAVNGISFTVEPGRIYGFLGPNGAGKSTTMNILTGCLAASEGSVKVNGHDIFEDPKAAKSCIGYLPELPPLYGDMTPQEYLTFVAEAKKVKSGYIGSRVSEVMEITGITDMKDRLIRNLSKGYRQRVGIAQAMLGSPDIIILDEPTVGLDPKQILEIRQLIRTLGETKTVILSSHILAEISAVCERVMIISHGNLVADDTIEHLEEIANRSDKLKLTIKGDRDKIENALGSIEGVISFNGEESPEFHGIYTYEIEPVRYRDIREDIFFAMSDIKCPILSMNYDKTTLEDIYLALTDDSVLPDDNGKMPSVEEILRGEGNVAFEYMKDTELEAFTGNDTEGEPEVSENEETQEKEDGTDGEEDIYRPLFGGK
ncbi:MAG: ATP-binding cassette domain-containing protein [Clostridia bacterium]|nr:ATP-binding cassette domain-containing protein [Clostridia bacterium]